jgi:hypothetical protein
MQLYLCKLDNWNAVVQTRLYYVSELRLAVNIKGNNFPIAGDSVQFLANRVLGTAVIQESHHNGYAGHFVLTDITESSGDTHDMAGPNSTGILREASAEVMTNIDELQHALFVIDGEQQALSASFAALESRKTSINRRIAGKSVQLIGRKRRVSAVTVKRNKKTKNIPGTPSNVPCNIPPMP